MRWRLRTILIVALIVLPISGYLIEKTAFFRKHAHLIGLHPGTRKVQSIAGLTLEDPQQRKSLPEYEDVPAAPVSELAPALGDDEDHSLWTRSQGDSASNRYSSLKSINRANVSTLQVAWTYHSKDGKANIQSNPVIADGVMYAPTAGDCIVAINAANGEEIWRFKPGARPAMRGLIYWRGNSVLGPRLYFTAGSSLFALDPKSGAPIDGFGRQGRVASGGLVAPVIFQDVIVVANWNAIEGHDIATGRRLWEFDVLAKPSGSEDEDQGGNCWGGISLDEKRGIVYLSTGSPHPNFIGVDHVGQNEHANSVIALQAKTGHLMWSFQEIRHDIWDLDVPAPPNLVTVLHEGKPVDAVAQVTKIGNTLLLDRVSGKPLFPFRLKRAPVSKLPGERTWPYQPVFERPEPFVRQVFTAADVTDISPEAHAFVAKQVDTANYGWFEPFESGRPTIYYGVHGGAQWTGAAFDPSTGRLYVSANELPWMMTVVRARVGAQRDPKLGPTAGEQVYRQNCAACHGIDRKGKGMAPPLIGITNRMLDDELINIMKDGRNSMPPVAMSAGPRQELFDFLFDRDIPPDSGSAGAEAQYEYVTKGYPKLLDDQGYPGSKPPWGTLNAIDLNTGKVAWKVPLGEYDELTKRGIPKTGTENFGGAIVTAGGLIFCGGTRDLKIRAFDSGTGGELWSYKLPFGGFATPATYQVNGRQYVVIAATGGGKLGGPVGDAYVAFALPQSVGRVESVDNETQRAKPSGKHQ